MTKVMVGCLTSPRSPPSKHRRIGLDLGGRQPRHQDLNTYQFAFLIDKLASMALANAETNLIAVQQRGKVSNPLCYSLPPVAISVHLPRLRQHANDRECWLPHQAHAWAAWQDCSHAFTVALWTKRTTPHLAARKPSRTAWSRRPSSLLRRPPARQPPPPGGAPRGELGAVSTRGQRRRRM